jgi:hypothetical protein
MGDESSIRMRIISKAWYQASRWIVFVVNFVTSFYITDLAI